MTVASPPTTIGTVTRSILRSRTVDRKKTKSGCDGDDRADKGEGPPLECVELDQDRGGGERPSDHEPARAAPRGRSAP